jgi:hypothetical protein
MQDAMGDWTLNLLALLLRPGTDVWFGGRAQSVLGAARDASGGVMKHRTQEATSKESTNGGGTRDTSAETKPGPALLCAPYGVLLGDKPGVFTGPGDAHAFRLAAYDRAGKG